MALSSLGGHAHQLLISGFGRWLPSHIAMRLREIQGLDHNESLENFMENGLLITARGPEEFYEIFGMAEMMTKCQDLCIDRGQMAQFFSAIGHHLYITRQGTECKLEYGQNIPLAIEHQPRLDLSITSPLGTHSLGRISDSRMPMDMHMHDQPTPVTSMHNQCGSTLSVPEKRTSLVSVNRTFANCGVQTHFEIRNRPEVSDYFDQLSTSGQHTDLGIHDVHDVDPSGPRDVRCDFATATAMQDNGDVGFTDFTTLV